ncbi:MAG: lipid-A-disaccharide synthase [Kiritimatiellae bacterium]|nr:lipid-A-disaccharide synthase [Kiritimatiellia bacterium]
MTSRADDSAAPAAPRSVLWVAGEISGDMHAGALLRALRRRGWAAPCWGAGGDALAAGGMDVMFHVRDLAVMGLGEVLRRLPFLRRVRRDLIARANRDRPALAILVDYPGMNLPLAAALRARGVRVVYYICPKVWAWNRARIPRMARALDRLLSIFPFEPEIFRGTGLRVDYVGNPLVEETRQTLAAPPAALPWAGGAETIRIGILPGSRRQEILRILPALWAAAVRLDRRMPGVSFMLASATPEMDALARNVIARQPASPARWAGVIGQMREVARQSRAAWVTSGTATLETALLGCPLVVVYKTSALTYAVGKRVIRVPYIGLVNLVANAPVCPELIQSAADPDRLADALEPLLPLDSPARAKMLEGYARVRETLGNQAASERAADAVLEEWAAISPSTTPPPDAP